VIFWWATSGILDVGLTATATDASGPCRIEVSVFSDEAPGVTTPDATLLSGVLKLRAERNVASDGRVYLIVVRATDPLGNVATACLTAVVPLNATTDALARGQTQASAARTWAVGHAGAPPAGWSTVMAPTLLR
jgi:hypothetical protein